MLRMSKCLAIDRYYAGCRNNSICESRFCKLHQYMNEYTAEMLEKLEVCGGCLKSYYFEGETKTCANCIERGKNNRLKTKESVVLCGKEGCKFKRSKENEYCGKHQLCIFEDETRMLNKKLCANYLRGCRSQLEMDYQYTKCGECLEIARNKDHERRENAIKTNNKEIAKPLENKLTPNENNGIIQFTKLQENVVESNKKEKIEKQCTFCFKIYPLQDYIGFKGQETKNCKTCREKNKIRDSKRDKNHRNEVARKNDKKPQRKAVKEKWNEENYEKVVLKSLNSKQRKIERLGVEEYQKQGAEQARKWREKNPEKMKVSNENKIKSMPLQYNIYKKCANIKNLAFEITYEEYTSLVEKSCYYCNTIENRGFNGIDRLNSSIGYIMNNCVSCCKMCNYLKGSLNNITFMKRIEHILTHLRKIDGVLSPECFKNHKKTSYNSYMKRANTKKLEFTLSQEEYNKITSSDCYLCGKKNTLGHENGIDRKNNDIGYINSNIETCCGECNYMKKNYHYDKFLEKLLAIYGNRKETKEEMSHTNDNSIIVKGKKKSKEEIKATFEENKIKKQNILVSKYSNMEYKMQKAKELAEKRKNSSED